MAAAQEQPQMFDVRRLEHHTAYYNYKDFGAKSNERHTLSHINVLRRNYTL